MQDIPQSTFTLTIIIELTYRRDYLTPEAIANVLENALRNAEPNPPTFHPDWEIDDLTTSSTDPEPLTIDPLDHPDY